MISHMVMENNMDMGSNPNDKKFYKGRNFQLTLNEPEKWNDLRLYVTGLSAMQYIIACKEKAPSTGHEHIHCYVQFKNPTKLVVSKLQGAHVEKCKGSLSSLSIALISAILIPFLRGVPSSNIISPGSSLSSPLI